MRQNLAGSVAHMGTSIAVVGPGAVGATVAACLHRAGYAVVLCGRTPRDRAGRAARRRRADHRPRPCAHRSRRAERRPSTWWCWPSRPPSSTTRGAGWQCWPTRTPRCVSCRTGSSRSNSCSRCARESTVVPAIIWFGAETQPGGWVRLRGEPRVTLPASATRVADLLRPAVASSPKRRTSPPRHGASCWSTRSPGSWCCPAAGRGCSGATTSPGCPGHTSRNAWRSPAPRAPTWATTVVDEMAEMFVKAPEDMTTSMLLRSRGPSAAGVGYPQRRDRAQGA